MAPKWPWLTLVGGTALAFLAGYKTGGLGAGITAGVAYLVAHLLPSPIAGEAPK